MSEIWPLVSSLQPLFKRLIVEWPPFCQASRQGRDCLVTIKSKWRRGRGSVITDITHTRLLITRACYCGDPGLCQQYHSSLFITPRGTCIQCTSHRDKKTNTGNGGKNKLKICLSSVRADVNSIIPRCLLPHVGHVRLTGTRKPIQEMGGKINWKYVWVRYSSVRAEVVGTRESG